MSDQPRPVWLTEADLKLPEWALRNLLGNLHDAAPADPAEAVYQATAPVDADRGRAIAKRVLRALGMPDAE